VVAVPSKGRADLQAHAPEADATRALYEQYGRQIYAFCFSRLRSREEAEDAVQSTFLNAFRALQRDVAPSHEAAWLYKIAENVCLTRARSSVRRRRVETPGDLEAISEVVPAHEPDTEELVNLPQALESMPEQQRRALLLREWQGLSYREIADEMELSQSAVETLLFRARRTLASGLAEEPRPRGKLARLRAGGDAGAVAALLKTLLFSGGGKVVIAGAVAASSVVGASSGTRHTLDDLFVPHMKAPVHHVAAAKPKHVVTQTPAVSHYVSPVVVHGIAPAKPKPVVHKHTAAPPKHAKKPKVVHHAVRGGHHGPPAQAPAVTPPPATLEPTAPTATATVAAELTPTPAPPADNGQGNGKAKGHDKQNAPESTTPTVPAPTPPAPVVPPVAPSPQPTPPQGNQGQGTGHGHDGHDHGH
jgi:RNA polymerase sigma-70 factor (ECF subfamily)